MKVVFAVLYIHSFFPLIAVSNLSHAKVYEEICLIPKSNHYLLNKFS